MSPEAAAINQALIDSIMTMRATVWGRTGGSGPYNHALQTGLKCRLDEIDGGRQPGPTSAQRREAAGLRTLQYDVTYTLPETGIQIEVTHEVLSNGQTVASPYAGKRWNPIARTDRPASVPGMGTIATFIDVERAV